MSVPAYITYRFIKLLTTPFEEWDAYKLGLIDKDGKTIKKADSVEEKKSMSSFHRLVKNIKRVLQKVPGGKTKTVQFAAAMMLLKEEVDDIAWENIVTYIQEEYGIRIIHSDYIPMICESVNHDKTYMTRDPEGNQRIIKPIQSEAVAIVDGVPIYEGKDVLSDDILFFHPNINTK